MRPEFYEAILERLQTQYGLRIDRSEHPSITEFWEGPLPLFKLIMAQNDGTDVMSLLMSFQIQLDIPTAIQWFAKVRQLDPNTMIAPCYIKDADGTSHVGEDAEIVLMYMVEQDIIAAFMQSERDPEDVLSQSVTKVTPTPAKVFSNYRKALAEFGKMKKGKGDISH